MRVQFQSTVLHAVLKWNVSMWYC